MSTERYIDIVEIERPPGTKTKAWRVQNIKHGLIWIGEIKWYYGFRKYVFFPEPNMLFDYHCLRLIADFCEQQTGLRRTQVTPK